MLRCSYKRAGAHLRGTTRTKMFFICLLVFSTSFLHAASGVEKDGVPVSVKERDSVTLHTDIQTNQQEKIKWYFNDTRIAQISGDLSYICTDVQCNNGTERFRDRLKLDNQTGSLTITNITNTDSGVYELQIIKGSNSAMIFYVTVRAEQDKRQRKSVKEGESVTLDPGEIRKSNNSVKWSLNDILIAEITGDQCKICTDDQCDERFRDRLKLDHQTGSLTITDTRTTHSGLYELQINSRRFSIMRSFRVTVSGSSDTGIRVIILRGYRGSLQDL